MAKRNRFHVPSLLEGRVETLASTAPSQIANEVKAYYANHRTGVNPFVAAVCTTHGRGHQPIAEKVELLGRIDEGLQEGGLHVIAPGEVMYIMDPARVYKVVEPLAPQRYVEIHLEQLHKVHVAKKGGNLPFDYEFVTSFEPMVLLDSNRFMRDWLLKLAGGLEGNPDNGLFLGRPEHALPQMDDEVRLRTAMAINYMMPQSPERVNLSKEFREQIVRAFGEMLIDLAVGDPLRPSDTQSHLTVIYRGSRPHTHKGFPYRTRSLTEWSAYDLATLLSASGLEVVDFANAASQMVDGMEDGDSFRAKRLGRIVSEELPRIVYEIERDVEEVRR